jgi:predicted  nucleic acid-binding Zn-ribbon protein
MPLPSGDQRVAYLEGRTEEHASVIAAVRTDIRDLRTEMRDLRSEMRDVRSEVGDVRSEMRDLRAEMIRRFEQMDIRFNWVIGLLFAVLLAMVSSAVGLLR